MPPITVGAAMVPVEVKPVSVPTLVILVCAAVDSVPVSVAPLLPIVLAFIVGALTVPCAVIVLVAVRVVNAPLFALLAPIAPVR